MRTLRPNLLFLAFLAVAGCNKPTESLGRIKQARAAGSGGSFRDYPLASFERVRHLGVSTDPHSRMADVRMRPRFRREVECDPDAVLASMDRGRCLVYGIFGPHSTIWSLFLALYVAAGFIGMMGALFGYAQWILETPARALWAVPAATLLAVVTYAVARVGRFLGREQTRFLYDTVEARLDAQCDAYALTHESGGGRFSE